MFLWLLPLDRTSVINAFGVFPQHPTLRNMITSMFVHANVWHLAWNMLFLWLFGPNVEDALG
ncbi:MAG: rhomboid family intramembrane serine protease, partial [Armatimonadetes bacterium]|nr:rhomboid family intramembrane serine protease [Armatimonadota bacterium]